MPVTEWTPAKASATPVHQVLCTPDLLDPRKLYLTTVFLCVVEARKDASVQGLGVLAKAYPMMSCGVTGPPFTVKKLRVPSGHFRGFSASSPPSRVKPAV